MYADYRLAARGQDNPCRHDTSQRRRHARKRHGPRIPHETGAFRRAAPDSSSLRRPDYGGVVQQFLMKSQQGGAIRSPLQPAIKLHLTL